jgi:hypothetical protein
MLRALQLHQLGTCCNRTPLKRTGQEQQQQQQQQQQVQKRQGFWGAPAHSEMHMLHQHPLMRVKQQQLQASSHSSRMPSGTIRMGVARRYAGCTAATAAPTIAATMSFNLASW